MNEVLVVVLVVGVLAFVSFFFRRRGYSPNQRIVLSGIAGGLLLWSGKDQMLQNPVMAVFYIGGVAVLVYAALYLRRPN